MQLESKTTNGVKCRDSTAGFTNGLRRGLTKNYHGFGQKRLEKPRYGKILALFVLGIVVLSLVTQFTWDGNNAGQIGVKGRTATTKLETKGTSHDPIHINGNSDFTAANGVVGGNGTQNEPYIIECWEINGNGGSYCICVGLLFMPHLPTIP